MNRIFGKSTKSSGPAPDLTETSTNFSLRAQQLDKQVSQYDQELNDIKKKLAAMPEGPSKNSLKQKAINLLRRKKLYENQRNSVQNRSFNVESTGMMLESMRDTKLMYSSLVAAKREMSVGMKGLNVDKFEQVLEDLGEFKEFQTEVEESLNAFSMDGVDEMALNEELDELQYEDYAVESAEPKTLENGPIAAAAPATAYTRNEGMVSASGSDRDDILRLL